MATVDCDWLYGFKTVWTQALSFLSIAGLWNNPSLSPDNLSHSLQVPEMATERNARKRGPHFATVIFTAVQVLLWINGLKKSGH